MRSASLYLGSLLLAAAGCEKTDPLFCMENPGATGCPHADGNTDDSNDPDMPPEFDARACFGASTGTVCLPQAPMTPLVFTNPGTFDTTDGASSSPACLATQPTSWKMAGHRDACFLIGTSISIDANLTVIGNRPLVLVSSSTITVSAKLDVGGHGATGGAGAPDPLCMAPQTMPVPNTDGGGGGAGGSFMSTGGSGGDGDNGLYAGGVPADADTVMPVQLRAGCGGQKGAMGQNTANGGNGGGGGGAVYLLAADSITIASGATINAGGGGGARAGRQGGGGGGGSGGMIWFYAPTISANGALIMANGAGGSSGGDDTSGTSDGGGAPGDDPSAPTTAAAGGTGTDGGGNGGAGYYNDGTEHPAVGGTDGASTNRGGGAGGGGRGFIQANVALTGATASPAPFTTQ